MDIECPIKDCTIGYRSTHTCRSGVDLDVRVPPL